MQTALVLMTILGCDDSASQCHYIATSDKRWTSVELCDASSESQLATYANVNYPVVIAVCQKPEATAAAEQDSPETATAQAPPQPAAAEETLAERAMARVKNILPTADGMRTLVEKPVHFVSDSYSWVARKLRR